MTRENAKARRRHAAMMSRGTGQEVVLRAGEKRSRGEVRIESWDAKARLLRAAKTWSVLWGLAIVSVLIPVAHFVLVPGFLIAGPISGFARYRRKSGLLGGEGSCPSCGARVTIYPRADKLPFREHCEECRTAAWVEQPS